MVQHPLLEALGALLGGRVELEVVGQLRQHRVQRLAGLVAGVVADVRDPAHRLAVEPTRDGLVEGLRRPPGGAGAEHLREGVGVLLEPACSSPSTRSTSPWCTSSRTTSASRLPASGATGSSRKRGSTAPATTSATWSSRTLVSPIAARSAASSTTRRTWAGSESQTPTRCESWAPSTCSRTTCSARKFSPTKSWRPRPSSSLRRGISAVCGIGRPRGWRKRAVTANQSAIAPHHRGLRGRVDEAPGAVLAEGQGVDDGRHHQQRRRDETHPAQPSPPQLVGGGVGLQHGAQRVGAHRPTSCHPRGLEGSRPCRAR